MMSYFRSHDYYEYSDSDDGSTSVSLASFGPSSKFTDKRTPEPPVRHSQCCHRHVDYSTNAQYDESGNLNPDAKRFSYCYLCSVDNQVYQKTEPVPMHKRRYLRPYFNPVQLMKKYSAVQAKMGNTKYTLWLKTGMGLDAGTTSPVLVKLYGAVGEWPQTELKSKTNEPLKFLADSIVEVNLEAPYVGDINKIQVWHNGMTVKDGWLLEAIEVSCVKHKQQIWRFTANQWISKQRSTDAKSPIMLQLEGGSEKKKRSHANEYFVLVKTTDKSLAGSDVSVQLQYVGSKGQSSVFNLASPYVNLFEHNQCDIFLMTSSLDLGTPSKIRLAHDGKEVGKEWAIEDIKVLYSKEPNKYYTFYVEKWLDKNQKTNGILRPGTTIDIGAASGADAGKMKIYHVTVITGSVKLAGTEARVFIEIAGSKGTTGLHQLHNSKARKEFARGQTDHFHIFAKDVGDILGIRLCHDNSGVAPGWFVDAVLIKAMSTEITGNVDRLGAEIKNQLEKLRQKMHMLEKGRGKSPKRSSSAEFKAKKQVAVSTLARSASAADRHGSTETLSRGASPSILKSSLPISSPRTRSDMMRKQVKFDGNEEPPAGVTSDSAAQPPKPPADRIDMSIKWVMSIRFDEKNAIKKIVSLENFDKDLQGVKLHETPKKLDVKKPGSAAKTTHQARRINSAALHKENQIYVFECKKWLVKDAEHGNKLERVFKLSSILAGK